MPPVTLAWTAPRSTLHPVRKGKRPPAQGKPGRIRPGGFESYQ